MEKKDLNEFGRYALLAVLWLLAVLLVFCEPDLDADYWFQAFLAAKSAGFLLAVSAFFLMLAWMRDGKAERLKRFLEKEG